MSIKGSVEQAKDYIRKAREAFSEAENQTRECQKKVYQQTITAGERWEDMQIARDEMVCIIQHLLGIPFDALDSCNLGDFESWANGEKK